MNPPPLAEWVLAKFASEPLIGDLREQLGKGRSRGWYWRQVANAVVHTVFREPLDRHFLREAAVPFVVAILGSIAFYAAYGLWLYELTLRSPFAKYSAGLLAYIEPLVVWSAYNGFILGLPLGLLPALLAGRVRSTARTTDGIRLVTASTLLIFVVQGWIVPRSNLAYDLSLRGLVPIGRLAPPSLTTLQLWRTDFAPIYSGTRRQRMDVRLLARKYELQRRLFMPLFGAAVGFLGWTLGRTRDRSRARAIGWWALALSTWLIAPHWLAVTMFMSSVVLLHALDKIPVLKRSAPGAQA
jgi:hypothetical protein